MENLEHIKKATPHKVINNVLCFLTEGIQNIFADDLVGIYLTGSLSYGDFNKERSDIDLAVVLKNPAPGEKIQKVKQLHIDAEKKFPRWAKRIECSYISLFMLENILPPKEGRPYFGAGKFCPMAKYGNEWIIDQYVLVHDGIALIGPEFKTLIKKRIESKDLIEARIRDLFEEWEPKIKDTAYLNDPHQQSYLVLHLCRILYTILTGKLASKPKSAAWIKNEFGEWKNLIEEAEAWRYGQEMKRQKEVVEFIRFVIGKVGELNKPKK
ncbi:MAG: aminoglycoside adenylyltransferase domain-containing protein [Candidatus Paceibacterota bacterium]|jgi:hypothetical protein